MEKGRKKMANEVAKTEPKKLGIAGYLAQEAVKQNVANVVGSKDTQAFISSIVSAVQANPGLSECTNASLLSAALLGHSLNLPPSPQLGKMYFVPYKSSKTGVTEAQFMLSYKGYLELAMRSGQYRKIHVTDIREGELKSYDPIEDEYVFEPITDIAKEVKHLLSATTVTLSFLMVLKRLFIGLKRSWKHMQKSTQLLTEKDGILHFGKQTLMLWRRRR